MTFKDYLTQLANSSITDDFGQYVYGVIFAKDVLRNAYDVELETKDNFFRHLDGVNADKWFIELARLMYQQYEQAELNDPQ